MFLIYVNCKKKSNADDTAGAEKMGKKMLTDNCFSCSILPAGQQSTVSGRRIPVQQPAKRQLDSCHAMRAHCHSHPAAFRRGSRRRHRGAAPARPHPGCRLRALPARAGPCARRGRRQGLVVLSPDAAGAGGRHPDREQAFPQLDDVPAGRGGHIRGPCHLHTVDVVGHHPGSLQAETHFAV